MSARFQDRCCPHWFLQRRLLNVVPVATAVARRTLAMVKPDAYQHLGKIIHVILEAGFRIK